jgi:hypothetical protein
MLLERPRNDHFCLSLDKTKPRRMETVTMIRHCRLGSHANRQLAEIMRDMWEELEFRLSFLGPVELLDVDQGIQVLDEGDLLLRNVVTIGRPVEGSNGVEVTSLSEIPGRRMDRYLGKLSLHFVKEEHLEMDSSLGGMAGFVYTFLSEVHVMARAQAVALGGNVITSFRMEQTVFSQDVRSNGYGVISVSGDIGFIEGL